MVNDAYEAGKYRYSQKQFKEAVDEWGKLTPYLNEQSGVL